MLPVNEATRSKVSRILIVILFMLHLLRCALTVSGDFSAWQLRINCVFQQAAGLICVAFEALFGSVSKLLANDAWSRPVNQQGSHSQCNLLSLRKQRVFH